MAVEQTAFGNTKNNILKLTKFLLLILAGFWVIAGVYGLVNRNNHGITPPIIFVIMGILMLLNAGLLILCSFGLGKRIFWYYLFSLLLLLTNIILSFTDQIGPADLVVLAFTLAPFLLLIIYRQNFVPINKIK
ncbi:MAG: hypothetical protein ACYDH1_05470 [Anaerolineaceae bacterium]